MNYNIDEITVPIITITDGWTVDEIETIEDCDDAYAVLTGIVASIEVKLENPMLTDDERGRCLGALRWKKAALQVIQGKRGRFNREADRDSFARRLAFCNAYLRKHHPEVAEKVATEMVLAFPQGN